MDRAILTKDYFITSLRHIAATIEEKKYYLSELDSAVGDGDHGINLSIGFREVFAQLPELENTAADIAELLNKTGFILLSKVGGASGPLYGGFFIAMAKLAKGRTCISLQDFITMLEAGISSIAKRGNASAGDKTMLDSLLPGINYLKNNLASSAPLPLFENALVEMQKGSDAVMPLVAKKGRAMRLGERAIGHRDPGAESAIVIMQAFQQQISEYL